jgi:hypothetical protein
MSTLGLMIDEINSISTTAAAVAIVKRWVEMPEAVAPDSASGPTGTRNCSLIAEFVARRYMHGGVSWKKVVMAKPDTTINGKTKTLPFKKDGVLYLAATGATAHELCLIRDNDYTALLHAWAGHFEVFPRLNVGFTYNVHGPGSDGEARVLSTLTSGAPIRGSGPIMPTGWAVVTI